MNRSMSFGGLRPIRVKPEVVRFAWIEQPALRAQVVTSLPPVIRIKKRPSGF